MKFYLPFFSVLILLATSGCIFRGDRDHADHRDRPHDVGYDEHSSGVDHGEHPGDMDHDEGND
jgi:hypothetical protein